MEKQQSFSITNFIPLQKIGEGSFSSVYKVKRKADSQVYALKKIKIASLKEKQKKNSLNEIRILASINSPFIVQYRQAFFDQNLNLLCIVMELANGGDLQNKIEQTRNHCSRFQQPEIWKMIYHIVKGLQALHSNLIMHRDIKSANVFISDGVYKLGDLNVSKILNASDILASTQTGTPYYASPQVWRDEPYDTKSDIWSIGCVIYEMCTLVPPFKGKDLEELYKKVQKGIYQEIPRIYSKDLAILIRLCLKKNPADRPTCNELIDRILIRKCIEYGIQIKQINGYGDLMKTIKLPINLYQLKQTLPKPAYIQKQPLGSLKDQQIQNPKMRNKKSKHRMVGSGSVLHEQNPEEKNKKFFQELTQPQKCQKSDKNSSRKALKARNYISQNKIKKSTGAKNQSVNLTDKSDRKLSYDQPHVSVSGSKSKKSIMDKINLLKKLSQNNINHQKCNSQRYDIENSMQELQRVGRTDRMNIRQSVNKSKEDNDNIDTNMQMLTSLIKKERITTQNSQRQLKKISSNCRLKQQLTKNKNLSYHQQSQLLSNHIKESANHVSFILNGNRLKDIPEEGRSKSKRINKEEKELLYSKQKQRHVYLSSHRKMHKISSTPYLNKIIRQQTPRKQKNLSNKLTKVHSSQQRY